MLFVSIRLSDCRATCMCSQAKYANVSRMSSWPSNALNEINRSLYIFPGRYVLSFRQFFSLLSEVFLPRRNLLLDTQKQDKPLYAKVVRAHLFVNITRISRYISYFYEVAIAPVTGARSKKTGGPVIGSSTSAATFTALTNSELLLLINSCFVLTRKWKMFAILRQMLTEFQHQIAGKIAAKEKYM